MLGDAADYLVEQAVAVIAFHNDDIVSVEIPASVELAVAETEPGIQGDRVSGARKPATLETGNLVQVPLFINIGDRLRVDTRSGDYITRVEAMARRGRAGGSPFADDERSDARERAMLLFDEADTKRVPVAEIAAAQVVPIDVLTQLLVDGTAEHRDELDEVIAANAHGWTLKRMPAIDLTVLRIATFELRTRLMSRSWSCSTRPSSSPSGSPPTTRAASSTACWPRSPASPAPCDDGEVRAATTPAVASVPPVNREVDTGERVIEPADESVDDVAPETIDEVDAAR